ncbi:MAG: hypothetical protein IT372_31035 [Polyangiaceae bacterium]|nr:hypothetical protein [Polyangiaceae bacterium]
MPLPIHVSVARRRDEPRDPTCADLRTWEKLLAHARDSAEREALVYLRELLGADYRGLRTSTSLAMTLMTRFQGGPPECVRLHEMLRRLEDQPHVRAVVSRGIAYDGTDYLHGMTVIELAAAARARRVPIRIYPPGGGRNLPDLDIARLRFEITCSVEPRADDYWSLHMDAMVAFPEVGLDIRDFNVDIDAARFPADAVPMLIEAARLARFAPTLGQAVGTFGFVSYAPGRGRFHVPNRRATLPKRVRLAVKKKRSQLRDYKGPRIVLVRVDDLGTIDLGVELVLLGDELSYWMRRWPEVSACIVLADIFAPMSGQRSFTHPRFRCWLGATSGGTARIVVQCSNPVAAFPLEEADTQLLVGADGLFVDPA